MTPAAAPAAGPLLSVRGLAKRYRVPGALRRQAKRQGRPAAPGATALDGLDLEVRGGEIYGVLGPNGAGKTTLMKVLGTILLPDAGVVTLDGRDLVSDADRLRPAIGLVLGEYERTFHWRLSGRQNLRFFADFLHIPRHEVAARIDAVLQEVGLAANADDPFHVYSTGMKHRLALARGLLSDPRLLLLDEPTAGLDPASSAHIAAVVRRRAAAGAAVVYTTHRLHEAGALCDRILVLDKGRRVAEATPDELVALAKGQQVVEARRRSAAPWARADVEPIASLPGVVDWETRGDRLLFHTRNEEPVVTAVVAALRRLPGEAIAVTVRPPDVEDAFLALLGSEKDGGAPS